ncbi:hypothetical protein D3C86_2159740 [compost metagenome]
MINVASENNRLARQLTIRIPNTIFHQVPQDDSIGVLVVNGVINVFAIEIEFIRINALILQLGDLLIG